MIDIIPEYGVEISVNDDQTVLWVNVDGKCELRACKIPKIFLLIDETYCVWERNWNYVTEKYEGPHIVATGQLLDMLKILHGSRYLTKANV